MFRTDILHEDVQAQAVETSASVGMFGLVHYGTRDTGSSETDPEFTLHFERIAAVGLKEAVAEHGKYI